VIDFPQSGKFDQIAFPSRPSDAGRDSIGVLQGGGRLLLSGGRTTSAYGVEGKGHQYRTE